MKVEMKRRTKPFSHDIGVSRDWWVVCFCAQWCSTCNEYRPLFDGLSQAYPAVRFLWVDIEDEADLVGDVDIPTFPMLLIAEGVRAHFFGPVIPRAAILARLLVRCQEQLPAANQAGVDAQQLLVRVRAASIQ